MYTLIIILPLISACFAGLFGKTLGFNGTLISYIHSFKCGTVLSSTLESNPHSFTIILTILITTCWLLFYAIVTILGLNSVITSNPKSINSKDLGLGITPLMGTSAQLPTLALLIIILILLCLIDEEA